ncbi:hypothetical protein Mchl_5692 (plasmid) [Methylorubrum extorquens CM4]|uniref:CobW/HypB/UreG nucleotide-binding domain-containing protein n=1 Tax=Methylorubrum extorquens (strain CM4 / NCIMB 13688) TaxID=440085 RepID=B7L3K4_METC4|nr:hypothetical protein Mchl_5692 [Methylorubrum extorquens CM4]
MSVVQMFPCTIVVGFLRACKSTLVRHAAEHAKGCRLAVLVKEFGDVGFVNSFLAACGVEGYGARARCVAWLAVSLARRARAVAPRALGRPLRQPVIAEALMVVIRCLGGLDRWRFGLERVGLHSGKRRDSGGFAQLRPAGHVPRCLATAPRLEPDPRRLCLASGPDNLRRLFERLAAEFGGSVATNLALALATLNGHNGIVLGATPLGQGP